MAFHPGKLIDIKKEVMRLPFIISVAGFKNTGKTTLCRTLLEGLRRRGLDVAYLKHAPHDVLSPLETDTGSVRAMGIDAAFAGNDGIRLEPVVEGNVRAIVNGVFPGKDVVVVEGAKETPLARIWVGGAETCPAEIQGVLAYYGDQAGILHDHPAFSVGHEEGLVDLVEGLWKKAESGGVVLMVQGRRVPAKDFVANFISGALRGMLKSLKGVGGLEDGFALFCRGRKDGDE